MFGIVLFLAQLYLQDLINFFNFDFIYRLIGPKNT